MSGYLNPYSNHASSSANQYGGAYAGQWEDVPLSHSQSSFDQDSTWSRSSSPSRPPPSYGEAMKKPATQHNYAPVQSMPMPLPAVTYPPAPQPAGRVTQQPGRMAPMQANRPAPRPDTSFNGARWGRIYGFSAGLATAGAGLGPTAAYYAAQNGISHAPAIGYGVAAAASHPCLLGTAIAIGLCCLDAEIVGAQVEAGAICISDPCSNMFGSGDCFPSSRSRNRGDDEDGNCLQRNPIMTDLCLTSVGPAMTGAEAGTYAATQLLAHGVGTAAAIGGAAAIGCGVATTLVGVAHGVHALVQCATPNRQQDEEAMPLRAG